MNRGSGPGVHRRAACGSLPILRGPGGNSILVFWSVEGNHQHVNEGERRHSICDSTPGEAGHPGPAASHSRAPSRISPTATVLMVMAGTGVVRAALRPTPGQPCAAVRTTCKVATWLAVRQATDPRQRQAQRPAGTRYQVPGRTQAFANHHAQSLPALFPGGRGLTTLASPRPSEAAVTACRAAASAEAGLRSCRTLDDNEHFFVSPTPSDRRKRSQPGRRTAARRLFSPLRTANSIPLDQFT